MSDCVACGHSVVAWCPHDSLSKDDLVCYYCGLHLNSEAAKRIRQDTALLRQALDVIESECKLGGSSTYDPRAIVAAIRERLKGDTK